MNDEHDNNLTDKELQHLFGEILRGQRVGHAMYELAEAVAACVVAGDVRAFEELRKPAPYHDAPEDSSLRLFVDFVIDQLKPAFEREVAIKG